MSHKLATNRRIGGVENSKRSTTRSTEKHQKLIGPLPLGTTSSNSLTGPVMIGAMMIGAMMIGATSRKG